MGIVLSAVFGLSLSFYCIRTIGKNTVDNIAVYLMMAISLVLGMGIYQAYIQDDYVKYLLLMVVGTCIVLHSLFTNWHGKALPTATFNILVLVIVLMISGAGVWYYAATEAHTGFSQLLLFTSAAIAICLSLLILGRAWAVRSK